MPQRYLSAHARRFSGVVLLLCAGSLVPAYGDELEQSQLIGVWRGTSTCTDRVAAPACHDETVVYEFTAGSAAGTVHWAADKLVNGQRERMGELDVIYDKSEKCWKAEFSSPRLKTVWRLTVNSNHLTGTARLLPGNETVRKVQAHKD